MKVIVVNEHNIIEWNEEYSDVCNMCSSEEKMQELINHLSSTLEQIKSSFRVRNQISV